MRNSTIILFVTILIMSISCENNDPQSENITITEFNIGENLYTATQTNLYITELGKIVEANGNGFQLYIVLSDKSGTSFEITDTLKANDENKARCILKLSNDYHISTSGTVQLGAENKTGSMQISFKEINLENGKLHIDSVITKPIIDFTNITSNDLMGNPMNEGDENDWIIRTDFQIIERLVFNQDAKTFMTKDLQIVEYPNPFIFYITMHFYLAQDEKVDLIMVNENFEIEQKILNLRFKEFSLALENPDFKGNYYRLYYKIYSDNEAYYGSGDLKVEE